MGTDSRLAAIEGRLEPSVDDIFGEKKLITHAVVVAAVTAGGCDNVDTNRYGRLALGSAGRNDDDASES